MARAPKDLWRAAKGDARIGHRELDVWRVVEGQHVVSTRKLVDTLEEQRLLEEAIDTAKPPLPTPLGRRLHYLLSTPFRYPPLRHGSRFGTRRERSLWYGAADVQTALAERAYYRLLFLDGGPDLGAIAVQETAFRVPIATARFVDLSGPPFADFEAAISSPSSYAASQPLGAAMRAAGVEAFAYVSARARVRGLNLALFEPVFARDEPLAPETWNCTASRAGVEFRHVLGRALAFPRADFVVDGALPAPGL